MCVKNPNLQNFRLIHPVRDLCSLFFIKNRSSTRVVSPSPSVLLVPSSTGELTYVSRDTYGFESYFLSRRPP